MARTSSRATEGPTSKRVSSRWLDGFMDLFRASTRSRESAKQAELVASTELRRAGSSPNAVDVDRRRRSSQRREAVNVVAIEVDLLTDEEKRRKQMRLFVVSLRWQIFLLLTAFVDIALMIVEIANPDAAMAVVIVTIFVLVIFAIDLMLRWYAYRLLNLRSAWFWFDLLIVSASVILSIVTAASADLLAAERGDVGTSAEVATATTTSTRGARAIRGVVMTMRALRALRFTGKLVQFTATSRTSMRHVTGQNKQRYVDLEEGFDLDVTYILPGMPKTATTMIAMSVPATGYRSLFRNPLSEVVRLLELKHAKTGYTIMNCCPELPYPKEPFKNGEIIDFDIQDHTPPTMEQFVQALNLAALAAKDNRVLAYHCRGGKGRTGSMCCAWLLYSREVNTADEALAKFGLQRTDFTKRSKAIQGVDTPSQKRYVHQLDTLLRAQDAYFLPAVGDFESEPAIVRAPEAPALRLQRLELLDWYAKAPNKTFVCAVHIKGRVVHWSAPTLVDTAELTTFELDGVEVSGDVRVSVFDLKELLDERKKRSKKGLDPRLPFDGAATGPWGEYDAAKQTAEPDPEEAAVKRVIAGKGRVQVLPPRPHGFCQSRR